MSPGLSSSERGRARQRGGVGEVGCNVGRSEREVQRKYRAPNHDARRTGTLDESSAASLLHCIHTFLDAIVSEPSQRW